LADYHEQITITAYFQSLDVTVKIFGL